MTGYPKEINAAIVRDLQSNEPELFTHALAEVVSSQNPAYIPVLLDTLHTTDDAAIKRKITSVLSELKSPDERSLILDAIRDKQYANDLAYLVSSCWESGVDHSEHLSLFIDLMTKHDLIVAFEAYTVIINMTGKISKDACEQQSKKIKDALSTETYEHKIQLFRDILEFLPKLS